MRVRILRIWEELRQSFWFLPTVMAVTGLGLALLLVQADLALRDLRPEWLTGLFIDDASGARSVLATIASSEITVAGVLFSITILVLNMASAQFGPRLIPNFMRQGATQVVLGTFLGSFIYCLAVLSMIRGGGGVGEELVPQAAVAVGLILGVASFGVLVYFIHRVAVFIQAPRIVDDVAQRLDASIDAAFPARDADRPAAERPGEVRAPPAEGVTVRATQAGYVQGVDVDSLLESSRELDGRIRLRVGPGDYVSEGDPLVDVVGALGDEVEWRVRIAIVLGPQRTQTQDPAFGVYQLVEIALRALSPGINDPFTAVSCIDRLGNALGRLAERDEPAAVVRDDDGALRLELKPCTQEVMVHAAFDQIRRIGADHLNVVLRLLSVLQDLLSRDSVPGFRAAVLTQAEAIREQMSARALVTRDRQDLEARYQPFELAETRDDRAAS